MANKMVTDLIIENSKPLINSSNVSGLEEKVSNKSGMQISQIKIKTEEYSKKIGKPLGTYTTVTLEDEIQNISDFDEKIEEISKLLAKTLPSSGSTLVVGLGNYNITPDALGPKVVNKIFATRHIPKEIKEKMGLSSKIRDVCAIAPGVLGQTGIEAKDVITSLASAIKFKCVIVIDALAAQSTQRLGNTIQFADVGLSPGSGVLNKRPEISQQTLGVPVISIGVPTVVNAQVMAESILEELLASKKWSDGLVKKEVEREFKKNSILNQSMVVTPKEIDLIIDKLSYVLAMSINRALLPSLSLQEIKELTSN